ncbi:MAG: DUF2452 domain-containing protein [Bacteroidota bacterium]
MADEQKKDIGKKIDVDQIDLDKMREQATDQPGLIPMPHTLGGAVIKPEDLGKVKGQAMMAMQQQTESQMGQLYDQMETLVKQAEAIKKRVAISERIYEVKMNFEPRILKEYYVYQRTDGTDFISLVAPHEWGRSSTLIYVAQVRLLADHTWEVVDMPDESTPL